MDEEGPYFSAVMSSPSDDGQCTDTDKEEESAHANEGQAAESEGTPPNKTSSHDDGSASDGVPSDVEMEDMHDDEHGQSNSRDSEQEDEEMRLRRKLLEKRAVATASNSTRESSPIDRKRTGNLEGKGEKRKVEHSPSSPSKNSGTKRNILDSLSDDEEMFSIQPKDAAHKERSHSARLHDERQRGRVVMENVHRRDDRSKEERHKHKEKKREKQQHLRDKNRDKYKRNMEVREDRARHPSGKQSNSVREREFSRLAGRVTISESKVMPRSASERFRRERGKETDIRIERHIKDTHRTRSPRKRDGSPLISKSRSSKIDAPPKKIVMERYEESAKIEVTISNAEVAEAKVEKKRKASTAIDIDADDVNDAVKPPPGSENDEDATPRSGNEASPVGGPSKYSKFDSSPDEESKPKPAEEVVGVALSTATDSEAESDIIMRETDDELESIEEEFFDEEKLLQLSPDTRARVEAEQQRRLIALLPVYYPGISGCRNVAEFECLNRIEEGTFGVVYRAKEKKTDEIVALKRLKMEKEKEGFPITSLREINMLLKAGNHPNIVNVREIVIGSTMDKIYLVMEYVEHDMKSLMDMMHSRGKHFTIGQVKTLLRQLLSGVAHMHDEWILHRDLKTSNLLLSHKGILKIGDFGLAREFGDPLKAYTPIVVTLWYRSPELLLGVKEYSTAVDMWSCGCIFAEFLRLKPLFPGKGELDQISKIFLELGTPNDKIWPGYSELPGPRKMKFDHHEYNQLWKKFPSNIVDKKGLDFLNELLRYDPAKRLSAHEAVVHEWFNEDPQPTPPELFPTWPAKSELGRAVVKSPITKPPTNVKDMHDEKLYRELKVEPPKKAVSTGFALKFDAVKFGD